MKPIKFWNQKCHKFLKLINIWPKYGHLNVGYLISKSTFLYINLSLNIFTESFETKIRNQNIIQILVIFVRIWCNKKKRYFILSRFFVQDDHALGWQGSWILTLWENVHLPVEAGGASFHISPSSARRQKTWSWTYWPWFSWQTCRGPSSRTSSWTWKIVPCQLQLANEYSLASWQFSCLASPAHCSSCTNSLESIKYQFLNSPLLFLTPYSNKDY